MAVGQFLYPEAVEDRPRRRSDCARVPRPCPYVGCRYHLYLKTRTSGSLRIVNPDLEPWQLPPGKSCALDVADAGDHSLEAVGETLNIGSERVRQIVTEATGRLKTGLGGV